MSYSPEQQQIINTAKQRLKRAQLPLYGRVAKSLIEAMGVESNYQDLPGGDRDSTGVLQQRNNGAWGVGHENPATDIDQYIAQAIEKNKGFKGSAGQLAQAVQVSAFPHRYDQHAGEAAKILGTNQGSSQAPAPSNVASYMQRAGETSGTTPVTPKEPSVYDVIARYRNATQPKTAPATSVSGMLQSGYDPQQSGQQIQATVEKIKQLRQPAQTALQTGDAHAAGISGNQDAPAAVASLIEEADKIDAARMPYLWGGGHGAAGRAGTPLSPLDCSGAVSRVLGIDPRVSGDFVNWGQSGEGKHVTIYANGKHVLMKINGHFFGTSRTNPAGGAGWIPQKAISKEYLSQFTPRHPKGM